MDVLNAKKGRKPLQYAPKEIDSELISDDEYDCFKGCLPDVIDEENVKSQVKKLILDSCQEKMRNNKVVLKNDDFVFKLQWEKYSSVVGSCMKLEDTDIDDDFKVESEILRVTLDNISKPLGLLKQNSFKIGREADEKGELFIAPKKTPKKLPKLSKKHKKTKKYYKSPEDMWLGLQESMNKKDTFDDNSTNKKKKRFGKRTRDIIRKKNSMNNYN